MGISETRAPSLRFSLRCASPADALRAPIQSGIRAQGAPRGAARRGGGALACEMVVKVVIVARMGVVVDPRRGSFFCSSSEIWPEVGEEE